VSEVLIDRRRSFWEVIADYNPLGKFGAAHSEDFSARQFNDGY